MTNVQKSDEYVFASLDVVSLFTNVPLKKNLDACQKTAFSFNGKMHEQTDDVSMGEPLGPVLANIIMT